jgi:hypothetical protein
VTSLLVVLALGAAAVAGETTVRAPRPVDIDDHRVDLEEEPAALLGASPEDAVLAAPGTSLVHEGGPLAPVRAAVRGLSGARLRVDLGGLELSEPATGLVDLAAVPFAFAEALLVDNDAGRGAGGGLRLTPSRLVGLRGRVLAGSLGTARASLLASSPEALVAVDAGMTRGDFRYLPTSTIGAAGELAVVRANNDQRRASALGLARIRLEEGELSALAFGAAHAGGIPGLATSPTRALRGEDALAGLRVALSRRTPAGRLELAVDGRAAHRATFGPEDERAAIESLAAGAAADVLGLPLGPALLDLGVRADEARLLDGSFRRASAAARAGAQLPLGPVRLRAAVDAQALTDVGGLLGGSIRAEVGDRLRASAALARASRAPTLDELYAPRGLVLGNPALRPEILDDVELALAFSPRRLLQVRAAAYAGTLESAIVYVNKNAYEVSPTNLGRAARAGLDTSVIVEPTTWARLDVAGGLLWSAVEATAAPLPLAAPFSLRSALRLGQARGPQLVGVVRSRGRAASNIYGTLTAPPYTLVDLTARLPIADNLDLGVAMQNALDVLDARDANQLPLPGRLFFVSLEVRG